jgi:hypothetical protein
MPEGRGIASRPERHANRLQSAKSGVNPASPRVVRLARGRVFREVKQ